MEKLRWGNVIAYYNHDVSISSLAVCHSHDQGSPVVFLPSFGNDGLADTSSIEYAVGRTLHTWFADGFCYRNRIVSVTEFLFTKEYRRQFLRWLQLVTSSITQSVSVLHNEITFHVLHSSDLVFTKLLVLFGFNDSYPNAFGDLLNICILSNFRAICERDLVTGTGQAGIASGYVS